MNDMTTPPRAVGSPAVGVMGSQKPMTREHTGDAVTIYDVARLAGVNPSTVSRALSGQRKVGAATKARVLAAVAELDYRFNPVARALPTGRTRTLAVVIADLTNPMFFDVLRGAERAAVGRGYTLVIADAIESERGQASAVERVVSFVDGLVLVTSLLDDDQITALARRKPLVILNRRVDGVSSVVPDVGAGIRAAVDHLDALGHQSIAYLSGPTRSWIGRARWEHIMSRASHRGISVVEIPSNGHTEESGREALARIRAARVTAVITYNDLMAIGLLRAATAAQLDVPRELSIIGFDDIFGTDFTSPPMSTVKVPLLRMGELAVGRALDLIDRAPVGSVHVDDHDDHDDDDDLATHLVVRDSTAEPLSR